MMNYYQYLDKQLDEVKNKTAQGKSKINCDDKSCIHGENGICKLEEIIIESDVWHWFCKTYECKKPKVIPAMDDNERNALKYKAMRSGSSLEESGEIVRRVEEFRMKPKEVQG